MRVTLVVRPSQNTDMSERRIDMTLVDVNHTTLYYELRGSGPSVMFVSGASGDAGHWTAVADALSDTFTVLTYDAARIRVALDRRTGRRLRSTSRPTTLPNCSERSISHRLSRTGTAPV